MVKNNLFESRYTGKDAINYEAQRVKTERYGVEVGVFSEYFEAINPDSVLDCPCGTGRWFDWYKNCSGPVFGIDKSEDMLGVASQKLSETPCPQVTFKTGDIFADDFSTYADLNLDLVVCVRFLNWVSRKKAKAAIAQLSQVNSRYMIVGVTVFPTDSTWVEHLKVRTSLTMENIKKRFKKKALQYVHPELAMTDCFEKHGWFIHKRTLIFKNATRENYFFLLSRTPKDASLAES